MRVTIPKSVREKLSVKDVNFLTYLETRNKNVEIKKLEFDLDEKINLIHGIKKDGTIIKFTEAGYLKYCFL